MFWTLLGQELRSLPRGRFTLLAAGVWWTILTLYTALVLGSEGLALYSSLVLMYVIPALALIPLTAGYVNSDRSSRFAQSLFTSPIQRHEYVLAKLAPPFLAAVLYAALTLPFFAVFAFHVGVPALVGKFIAMELALAAVGVSMGGLIGNLFVGRSTAAPIGAAIAYAAFAGAAMFLLPMAIETEPGTARDVFVAVVHASPLVVAFDAFDLHGGIRQDSVLVPGTSLALVGVGALAANLWIFTKQQAAETWEITRVGRFAVPAMLLLLLMAPAVLAAPTYEPRPPSHPGSRSSGEVTVLFVRPGGALPGPGPGFRSPLPIGEELQLDLLVLFSRPPSLPLRDFQLRSMGENATIEAPVIAQADAFESQTTGGGASRDVLRVPARVTFSSAGNLGRTPLVVGFQASWQDSEGDHSTYGEQVVWVHKPGAQAQLGLAGLPSILLCLGPYTVRRWRFR